MKKITLKAILLIAVVLCGMTNTMKAATITVSSNAVVAGVNYNTIQAAYDYVKALPTLTEKYVIELQSSYDPTTGVTLEAFPITFAANTASADFDITIKPAAGVKKTLAVPNQTVIATGMTFAINATTLDLTGKITIGDISMISATSYIAGMGTYTSGTFKQVTSVAGNILTIPSTALTAAKAAPGVNMYFGTAQTKTLYFNGAKYITIDGVSRTGATGLTIENPNCIYAQTIYFTGNSQYNTIKNCIVRGANQSGAWNNGWQGTIFFAGAQYNTIDNNDVCDMNDPKIPYPICAFQMTAAGGTNTNNTVSNNNVYNISNQYAGNGTCIFMQFGSDANSVNHSVLNNRFYWTAPTSFSTTSINFYGVGTTGLGHRFEGNIFGYGASNGTGRSTLTFTGSGTTYAVATLKNSTCKNNIIANIDINGTTFVGYQLAPHTAGSLTDIDEICYGNQMKDITVNSAANGTIYGLFFSATPTTNVNVKNNIIKNLTISSATGTVTNTIYGVSHNFASSYSINITTTVASASATITGGSTLASGITYTLSGNANIPASTTFTYSGSSSITLSTAATTAGTSIATTAIAPIPFSINCIGNEISNLTAGSSGSSANNSVIAFMSGGCSNIYEKNMIYNLNVISSGTGSVIKGLRFATSKASGITIKNNIIRLGTDVSSNAEISAIINEGLSSNGHPFNIYHNSIYIGGGTGLTLTKASHCFNHSSGANYGSIIIKNNIFCNVRNGGAVNQIFNTMSLPVINASTNNLYKYGSLFATVTTTTPATYATLDDWNLERMTSSLNEDTNSKNQLDPQFIDAVGTSTPDMHVPTVSPANENGIAIATVTDDFAGLIRADYATAETTNADMGALVISNSTAVEFANVLSSLSVYALHQNVIFNNLSGNKANIYSLSGQLVKSITITSDYVAVPAARGLYIVKVAENVTKVLVK